MLKTVEDVSTTKKRLTIEIPAEAVEAEIQKALTEVQRNTKIPGFRPGKAPLSLIEKRFGKNVEAEVLERIVPQYYASALHERNLKPISGPQVEESLDFKRNAPLSMTVTVEVRPEVEGLKYDSLTVREVPVEITDDEVTKVIHDLAEERASYEPVDEAVQAGDLVTIDYDTEESNTSARGVVIKVGSGPYPAEFTDSLVHRKKEEPFKVEASFPEDSPTAFAGKRQSFTVTIREVKRRTVSPVDDEFGKDLGFDSLDALRESVRERIRLSKTREGERKQHKEILDALVEAHMVEVPQTLLDTELSGLIGEALASGSETRTEEELREEFKPKVEQRLRGSILLEIIGEKEGVTVSDEELKQEVITLSRMFQMPPENVIKYYAARDGSLERLKRTILERKVLSFLLSSATKEGAPS